MPLLLNLNDDNQLGNVHCTKVNDSSPKPNFIGWIFFLSPRVAACPPSRPVYCLEKPDMRFDGLAEKKTSK